MFRKVMSIIIMFTLFLGLLTSVGYGEVKSSILTKVEAEKLAREKLNLDDKDYKLGYSNLHTRDIQQRQFWNLAFEGDKSNASIVMAADSGEIISFNKWNSEAYGKAVTLLKDDAKKIAIDFIKSLESEKLKETEEVSVEAPTVIPYDIKINFVDNDNYHFMFARKINGEFFPNNYFRVTVSGVDGTVTSYEMKWDSASYDGKKQLITEQRARRLFESENRFQLKYVRLNKYNEKEGTNVILTPVYVYTPKESDKINAIDGKLISFNELYNWNYYGYPYYRGDMALENEMMAKAAMDYRVEMIPEEGVISKERAEEIVINMIKDHVNMEGLKLNSTSYTNYYAGLNGKFWSVYWYSNEGVRHLSSVINAETGDVLELSYYKNEDYEPLPIREIVVLEKSEDIKKYEIDNKDVIGLLSEKVEKVFPKTKGNLKLELQSDNKSQTKVYASSSRYIDDIPFEDNAVHISYSIDTQEITSLTYRWYDIEVQKGNSMLSKQKVSKIFYDSVGFEKYLVQLKDLEKFEKEGLEIPRQELLPVYGIKTFEFQYIDALTGRFLNYLGEEFTERENDETKFVDLEDSPYKKDILLMDKMGMLNVIENTFNPHETLLRKDALKWIIEIGWSNKAYSMDRYYAQYNKNEGKNYFKDVAMDDPYYKYVQAAVEFGILDNGEYLKPDEKINKIEMTEWIINAMKQKELAKYSSIFKVPYKDAKLIKPENVGYVALAKYYNIFGDKGLEVEFNPNKNFSRDEFVHVMYEFIKNY